MESRSARRKSPERDRICPVCEGISSVSAVQLPDPSLDVWWPNLAGVCNSAAGQDLLILRESSDDPAALPPQPRTARSLCATGCCPAATWAVCLRRALAASRPCHGLRQEA